MPDLKTLNDHMGTPPVKSCILFFAFLIYLTAAIFNNGYFHYDEHYQLIEFAELKFGNNKPTDLAWEYSAQIRPATQPAFAYVFFLFWRTLGITDHYFLITSLRCFSASLAVIILTFFINKTQFLVIPAYRIWYRILGYFMWFLPFLNVRFSSESYSGLLFILSIAVFYTQKQSRFFIVGGLLALSCLFRFQTAFLSLGFLAWLIFVYKINIRNLGMLSVGSAIVFVLGFALDYWFYGNPTITILNYYVSNIVHDTASFYGVSAWYYYFFESAKPLSPLFAVIIWSSIFAQLVLNRRALICWALVPFLLAHILVPHKELRFLFPAANLIPLFLILSFQDIKKMHINFKGLGMYRVFIIAIFVTFNSIALIVSILSPADPEGRMNITQWIHRNCAGKKIRLWAFIGNNPYNPIGLSQNFYLDKNVLPKELSYLERIKVSTDSLDLLVMSKEQAHDYEPMLGPGTLMQINTGGSDWIERIKFLFGYENKSLYLYTLLPRSNSRTAPYLN